MRLFSRKKKSDMKEYQNEYSKEQKDLFRKGSEIVDEAPDFTMEQIDELSKNLPHDHYTQDLKNPQEFKFRQSSLSYSMAGNLDECIDNCNKGLEINPQSPFLLYMKGRTLSDLKQFRQGIEYLAKAVELRSDFADAWYEIGRIHQMNNDMDNAILTYYKAQQLEPDNYKISANNPDVKDGKQHGVLPKFTQTLNEKGVSLVLEFLENPPNVIDCVLTGYFGICSSTDLLPEYTFPPKNIRLLVHSESILTVREWVNQLSIILNENGIPTQLNENELVFQINTFDEESQEWVPSVIFSPDGAIRK